MCCNDVGLPPPPPGISIVRRYSTLLRGRTLDAVEARSFFIAVVARLLPRIVAVRVPRLLRGLIENHWGRSRTACPARRKRKLVPKTALAAVVALTQSFAKAVSGFLYFFRLLSCRLCENVFVA